METLQDPTHHRVAVMLADSTAQRNAVRSNRLVRWLAREVEAASDGEGGGNNFAACMKLNRLAENSIFLFLLFGTR